VRVHQTHFFFHFKRVGKMKMNDDDDDADDDALCIYLPQRRQQRAVSSGRRERARSHDVKRGISE
jgi:hypothetical protein